MDFKALVDEITRRVLTRVEQLENNSQSGPKPRLLVLTAAQNARFDQFLQSTRLSDCYELDCVSAPDPDCELGPYQAVILLNLKIEELARISSGGGGSAYANLAARAILSGKRMYLPAREIELLCYEQTAPPPYYAMMKRKLDLLAASGITICSLEEIEAALMGQASAPASPATPACAATTACTASPAASLCPWRVDRRVLTEKDLIEARMNGAFEVHVKSSCIITDLARDFAKARKMTLIRD
jgi:ethanolamine utilization protein